MKVGPHFATISFRYVLILPNGFRSNFVHVPTRDTRPHWFHIVFNIIGPNDGEGFRIYHDGKLVGNATSFDRIRSHAIDGRIVIGRFYTDHNSDYASFDMDELLFFNRSLTESEIQMMNN